MDWTKLFAEHYAPTVRWAQARYPTFDAEEQVQNAFVFAWERGHLGKSTNIVSWLQYRVMYQVNRDMELHRSSERYFRLSYSDLLDVDSPHYVGGRHFRPGQGNNSAETLLVDIKRCRKKRPEAWANREVGYGKNLRLPELPCPVCGDPFRPKWSNRKKTEARKRQATCSQSCGKKLWWQRKREAEAA